MAKRSRLGARPGQRRPLQRPAARPETPRPDRPAASVTPEELSRAAELEAAILAEERSAEQGRRAREQARRPAGVPLASEPLAVRAAEEYAYVRRDVRRITVVGGALLGLLAILYVLLNVVQVA